MTALDQFSNTATFSGTVNMTTNGGTISPTTATFASGTVTRNFTLNTANATKTITATNISPSATVTSNSFALGSVFYSRASGNWTTNTTWSYTSGGAAVGAGVYPVAGDVVNVVGGYNVTLTANAACASISFTTTTATSLTLGAYQLDVSGAITIPRAGSGMNTLAVGAGTLNATSIAFTSSGTSSRHQLTISTGTANITGNITVSTNGDASAAIVFSGAGILNLGGNLFSGGGGTLTQSTGTVNCNGAAQTIRPFTFYNLTLSGSGTKTFATTPTVNGVLSLEGTAIVTVTTGVVTYGANATLQYNKPAAYTATTEEWITPFAATGGVIIANTGAITMGAAKVFNTNIPLTINSGATLTPGTNLLTLGGDFINNGTLTSGSGGATITGTRATQSIAGFTTTGTVSMTKTGGNATLQGNVNGGALTLNGNGGTLNLGAGLTHTFTGAWTRTNGTLNGGSSLLRIGGNVSGTGGTFTAGTGTVEFYGASQTAAVVTYNNLTVSGTGTKTFATTPTVNGVLSMEGAATIAVTTGVVTYGTNATLQYNKPAAYTATAEEWITPFAATGGIKIINTGVITTPSLVAVNAPISIDAGSTLNTGANGLSGSGTLTNLGNLNIGGAFSMTNLIATAIGNTVNYTGAAQVAKPTTYSNLILSGSNVKTFATTPTVNEKLSMEGAATIAVTSGVVTYGTDATLQYNKPAASNATAKEWISPFTAKGGVVIANAGEVTLDAAKAIDSKLTINTGAKLKDGGNALSINAGAQFTNAGTLTNASPLTINSDLVKGAGTLLNSGTISGTATVNQAVDIAHSWYMSSPVASTTPIGVGSGGYYDEPTATWTAGIALTPGKGYSLIPNAATVAFSGALNNGNVAINLTESGVSVPKHGFNLLGNPYPSYLDWPTVYAANSTANMPTSTMWYRTKQSGVWAFATVDGLGNTVPITVSSKIPPMQAFWVRTEVNNSTFNFTNAMRLHSDATLNILKAPAKKNTDISRLRLTVTNGINTDEALIFFNDAVSNGFDKYDSPKMSNDNVLIPEIYSMAGNEKLVINGLNNTVDNQEFALGFTPGQANTFSIRVTELSNFEVGTQVFIYDKVLEKGAELTDGSPYTFTSDATPTASRFTIGFKAPGVTTSLSAPTTTNEFGVIYANGQLTVNYNQKLTGKSTLSLYNTMGQQLMTQEMNSNYTALDISLTDGVYLVSIINNGKRSTQKIAIR